MFTATFLKRIGSVEQNIITEMATAAKRLGNNVKVVNVSGWMIVTGLLAVDHEADEVLIKKYGFNKLNDYE